MVLTPRRQSTTAAPPAPLAFMRPKLLLPAALPALALVAGLWIHERSVTRALDAELSAARAQHRELVALESERNRLRALLPGADELASLRASLSERDRLAGELAARETISKSSTLPLGTSKPWRSWETHGSSTPGAALETALWAAAGGDTQAFATLIELDPSAREKAARLLAQLPPDTRRTYASPEALVASVSMKNIPLGDAQLTWLHETDADHANLALLLRDPDRTSSPAIASPPGPDDKPPPQLPDAQTNKLTFLSLHRTESGWRLTVPESAIDRIARELSPTGN
jgi:hypothetical protein